MERYISNRVINEALLITSDAKTIREIAKIFNIGKSTVHKDLRERLPILDSFLSVKVNNTLASNFNNKHIRGGEKTRLKYQSLK